MHTHLLAGTNILVTRPEHQAQPLCELLNDYGGHDIRLPVIQIEAHKLAKETALILTKPDEIDFAIFISPNAVSYGLAHLIAYEPLPASIKLVTIGQASAKKMYQMLGKMPDITPIDHYNSESLLALDSLQSQQVNNKNIIIFRGLGGRELLAIRLKERGAKVVYAEVYQRLKTKVSAQTLAALWKGDKQPDIITSTSNEGLHNLFEINADYREYLQKTPLVVVTHKMHDSARQLGFNNDIIIAKKASNNALLEAVLQWAKTQ